MKTTVLLMALILGELRGTYQPKTNFSTSQNTDTFPVPRNVPNLLFHLQRDLNSDTICYTLNKNKQGTIDGRNPVNIFWICYSEDGQKKELTYLQRKFAYGLKIKFQENSEYAIYSMAYPDRPLFLRKTQLNGYEIYTQIDKRECALKRIFVHISGGSTLSPKVGYIELHGVDFSSGESVFERIYVS